MLFASKLPETKEQRRLGGVVRGLHVYAGNLFGGIETLLVTLSQEAARCEQLENRYALCFAGRLSEELTRGGATVELLGRTRISRPWTVLMARHRLRRLLAQDQPNVVISHGCWSHTLFGPTVRRAGVPLVHWAHDVYDGKHWLERLAARTPPAMVLCNSRLTQAHVGSVFGGVKSEVVYLPVANRVANEREQTRNRVRGELGTAQETVVGITACRLERWKGHTLLLEALARLRERPGWEWWLVGGVQRPHEESYFAELKRQVEIAGLSGQVRFLGQRTDVGDLLRGADLHCQPNTGPEPFGLTFIEAMYAGLPVVTTAMGGALEIVTSECGLLIEPADGKGLATALGRLMSDPGERQRLGEKAVSRAVELCDPARQIGRVSALLAGVCR